MHLPSDRLLTPDHDPGIVFLVVLAFSSLATKAEPRAYSQHVTCHHQVSIPGAKIEERREREVYSLKCLRFIENSTPLYSQNYAIS